MKIKPSRVAVDYMSFKEVSDYLGVHPTAVYSISKKGTIPTFIVLGKKAFLKKDVTGLIIRPNKRRKI